MIIGAVDAAEMALREIARMARGGKVTSGARWDKTSK